MYKIGIDMGASSVRIVVLDNRKILRTWETVHYGRIAECLREGLGQLDKETKGDIALCITGSNRGLLKQGVSGIPELENIPAVVEGVKFLVPDAGSVIEIGSQGSSFITEIQKIPEFATNGHCAGGTGSFFEDQMSRLGMKIEDYSEVVSQAKEIPRISGRCAVFAKTDIIHRQQEGILVPDVLLGLCYAMIRNYKATIIRKLPVRKPVVFCGGVTKNKGVEAAIRDVLKLKGDELVIPEYADYAASIGAAEKAHGSFSIPEILVALQRMPEHPMKNLAPLRLHGEMKLKDPEVTGNYPSDGCALGIDIGSTSTDLVLTDREGRIVDLQYLRTAGDPEAAVRTGLSRIREKFGEVTFRAVGVTGSGRERIGKMIGADVVKDEITAQAAGASFCVPEADTVFEIGGQDSKFISLKNGEVVDFQMNKICAAGTGSFIEEQAARMGIPIGDFGTLALDGKNPVDLGERCTVFIETAIAAAEADGASKEDLAAGLCYSIIRNYLHKVVGSRHVGEHIVLQGGVNYNPGIVAAFQMAYGDKVRVNPYFSVSGAFGVALLAWKESEGKTSRFKGFDFSGQVAGDTPLDEEIKKNIQFYRQANELLLDGYDGRRDPAKKTVGVPFALMIHKFFPMANAFFRSLGYNVVLTDPTNEETIRLSQESARGETCYPVKLIYGHMRQLIDQKVDYIFLPTIHTMKHETSKVEHNYGCVYMQTAPESVAKALELEKYGIQLLSPVFDLDFGKEAMAAAMLELGKTLGIPKPFCAKALLEGSMAVRKHTKAVEKQGEILLKSLKPDEKVLVLITRNYGISDPVLNMGIPEKLLERGCKVITLSHLPAHDLDISMDHPNLYWPFGQHILSGAKLVANHPNLYAVYLTNHGCGPDTMLSHLFREEMGNKPYLQIEVDEHFSPVGVITRIEAFLNSLKQRPSVKVPEDYNWKEVPEKRTDIMKKADPATDLYLPAMGWYGGYLGRYLETEGIKTKVMDLSEERLNRILELGRSYTAGKEYLPFVYLLGSVLMEAGKHKDAVTFFIPETLGAEADGQYVRVIKGIASREIQTEHRFMTADLEKLYDTAADLDQLFRAVTAADLQYLLPENIWEEKTAETVPEWEELCKLAAKIGNQPVKGRVIAAVGGPLCLTVLNDGILADLEQEGNTILRSPAAELLLFSWMEHGMKKAEVERYAEHLEQLAELLGPHSPYCRSLKELQETADRFLPKFDGGNGRYRYAKAVQIGNTADVVLTFAPRYENTAMVLEMRELKQNCKAPLYDISLDHDRDESTWSRLKSFLYYC